MASSGRKKGGKKNNWKPVAVDTIIDASVKKSTNWADEVDQALQDDLLDHVQHKNVVLPTAPRASRASDFDESKIPHVGPFQIHVSNVPYELEEDELIQFFGDLQVKQARLPKEEGKKKGYGYVEFQDRQSLIAALTKSDTVIKNRPIKIELSMADQRRPRMDGRGGNRDGGMRGGDMGGPDRTAGNWRSGPRDDYDPPMERGGGFRGGGGRDFSSGSGGYRSGGFDRDDRGGGGFGRDGGGFRDDRGSYDRERGDSGYSRDDRRRDDYNKSYGGRDDRGGGFSRDNRGGYRERDDDRREERGGGGGSWRDDSRGGNFNKFEDRRDRGGYGPPMSRRDDGPPMSRRDDGPPMSRRDDGPPMSRRDDGPPMSRRDDGPPMSRRDDGPPMSRRDDGPPMHERAPPTERKRLNLQPRSSGLPATDKPIVPSAAPTSAIFGGAKPVDTTAREREVEERLNRGDEMPERSRSGPGSTTSSKDYQEERDKTVEPAPPPRENPWHKKSTSPVVNNGRTTPDGPSGDERGEGQRSYGRGESRRQEPRHTDDHRERNRPPPKSGPPSSGPDKGRPREERQNKSREPRKDHNVDDHKMPKLVENKVPNFVDPNKYNPLDEDEVAE